MVRICKDRKTKYKSLGISVNPVYWDFTKNKPKHNCPNREYILKIILEKETELQKHILELMSDNKEFTASTLIFSKSNNKTVSVDEFYKEIIKDLKMSEKLGNAQIYKYSYNSLYLQIKTWIYLFLILILIF
jgi:hypothetical protein